MNHDQHEGGHIALFDRPFVGTGVWTRLGAALPEPLPDAWREALQRLSTEAALVDRLSLASRRALSNFDGADAALCRLLRREGLLGKAREANAPVEQVAVDGHEGSRMWTKKMAARPDPARHHFLLGAVLDAMAGVTRATASEPQALGPTLHRLAKRILQLGRRMDRISDALCRNNLDAVAEWLFAEDVEEGAARSNGSDVGPTRVAYPVLERTVRLLVERLGTRNVAHELARLRKPVAIDPRTSFTFGDDGRLRVSWDSALPEETLAMVRGRAVATSVEGKELVIAWPADVAFGSVVLARTCSEGALHELRDWKAKLGHSLPHRWAETLSGLIDVAELSLPTAEPTLYIRRPRPAGWLLSLDVLDERGARLVGLGLPAVTLDRPQKVVVHWRRDPNVCDAPQLRHHDGPAIPMHGHLPLHLPHDLPRHHPLRPLIDELDLILRIPPMLIGPPYVCGEPGDWVIIDVRAWPAPEAGLEFDAIAPDGTEVLVDPFRPDEARSEVRVLVLVPRGATSRFPITVRARRSDGSEVAETVVQVYVDRPTGRWRPSTGESLGLVATHSALMPGPAGSESETRVLSFGYDEDSRNDVRMGEYQLWSSRTMRPEGGVRKRPLSPFCAGHAHLANGDLLVVGGHTVADPARHSAAQEVHRVRLVHRTPRGGAGFVDAEWEPRLPIRRDRWYPTLTTLPSGQVPILGGSSQYQAYAWNGRNEDYEIYVPELGQVARTFERVVRDRDPWSGDGGRNLESDGTYLAGLYPLAHLLPSLRDDQPEGILLVVTEAYARLWDPRTNTLQGSRIELGGVRTWHTQGTSVLLPIDIGPLGEAPEVVRVLVIGGGTTGKGHEFDIGPRRDPALDDAVVLEYRLSDGSLARYAAPIALPRRRMLCDSVLLPDGTVFVTGGAENGYANENQNPVLEPWIFTSSGGGPIGPFRPRSDPGLAVQTMAAAPTERAYHASAVLLPNARVFVGGSSGGWGGDRFREKFNVDVFEPPYLFCGPAPVITDAPRELGVGQAFEVETRGEVQPLVTLVRFRSSTHSLNTDQRLLRLHARPRGDTLRLQMPVNRTLAPPGYYMLFVLSPEGHPSAARIVRVRTAPTERS